ncbi:tail fiber domain-containing protein [Candidatus Uhrbacteria bacterium]|nr:tail fiber domain-containing protein [Candidatus Uhrbacteria bacterium]
MKRLNLRYIVPLSAVAILSLVFAANAQFTGPSTQPTGGNVPGVIWNTAGSSAHQEGANINFGTDATGGGHPGGYNFISDVGFKSGRAIRVDNAGASTLDMRNLGAGAKPLTFNVYGGLRALGITANPVLGEDGRIQADKYCFNPGNPADCITTWPSGGAGSYVLKAGDTMTGNLTMTGAYPNTSNWGGYGGYFDGAYGSYSIGRGVNARAVSSYIGADVTNGYAAYFNAQNALGTSYGLFVRGSSAGPAGYFVDAGSNRSVELANPSTNYGLSVSGNTRLGSINDTTTVSGTLQLIAPTTKLCLGLSGGLPDCRTAWPSSGTPGGANTQIQYNNSGAFGGSANLTYDNANTRMTVYKTLNVNVPGTYLGNLLTEEGIKSYNSINLADGYAHCAGDFRSVAGATVWIGCRQQAGYFSKGTTALTLADGTYAISAIGLSSLQDVDVNNDLGVDGVLTLKPSGAPGTVMRVGAAEALWYDGTYFSWGYGGTANYFADNVGIKTTTPGYALDVADRMRVRNGAAGTAGIWLSSGTTDQWFFGDAIGGAQPAASRLIGFWNPTIGWQYTFSGAGVATKPGGGAWAAPSDLRLKTNVKPMTGALEKLSKLNGVNFEWKNPELHGGVSGVDGGFIAQDVEKSFPNWVAKSIANGNDASLVNDGEIKVVQLPYEYDALVVESIKELKAENDALKAQNETLELRLRVIESRLNNLK